MSPYNLILFPQLFACEQPNEDQDYCNHKQYMYQRAYAGQSKETN